DDSSSSSFWFCSGAGASVLHSRHRSHFVCKRICSSFRWRYAPRPQGQGDMSLSTFLGNVDKFIKIDTWLQIVGYMLLVAGLIGAAWSLPHPVDLPVKLAFGVAFVGVGVSMAGFDYTKIYP